MGKVAVMHFEKWDDEQGINVRSDRRATRDLIARLGAKPLEDTVMEVDESDLYGDGWLTRAVFDWQERPSPHGKHDLEREILEELERPPVVLLPCHDTPFRVKIMFMGPHEEAAKAKIECSTCNNPLAKLEREIDQGKRRWRWESMQGRS